MNFHPPDHGFHFSNFDITWSVRIPIPLLPGVTYKHSSTQLCGGMVYAALDYFLTGNPIPGGKEAPREGTTLHDYIFDRQNDAHVSTVIKFGFTNFTAEGQGILAERLESDALALQQILPVSGPLPICLAKPGHGHHVLALNCFGSSPFTIKVYDPCWPDVTTMLTGDAGGGLVNSQSRSKWTGFFVDTGYTKSNPPVMIANMFRLVRNELDWRWCGKCMGLFYAGDATNGECPAKGPHVPTGDKNYRLRWQGGTGEHKWRWCKRCQALYFGGNGANGRCPRGGEHDNSDTTDYVLAYGSASGDYENGWRYCRACAGLYYHGDGRRGVCPVNSDGHSTASTWDYYLAY